MVMRVLRHQRGSVHRTFAETRDRARPDPLALSGGEIDEVVRSPRRGIERWRRIFLPPAIVVVGGGEEGNIARGPRREMVRPPRRHELPGESGVIGLADEEQVRARLTHDHRSSRCRRAYCGGVSVRAPTNATGSPRDTGGVPTIYRTSPAKGAFTSSTTVP